MKNIQPWLLSMINAQVHTTHNRDENLEKTYFCVDCGGNSLSKKEVEENLKGHKIFRPKKNFHHYTYRKVDILSFGSDILNVFRVCNYCINSTNVYFPKPISYKYLHLRGQLGSCFSCGKSVKKPFLFCSILCKLVCNEDMEELEKMKLNMDQESLSLSLKDKKRKSNNGGQGKNKKMEKVVKIKYGGSESLEKKTEELKEKGNNIMEWDKLTNFRTRARKGIRHRAPIHGGILRFEEILNNG